MSYLFFLVVGLFWGVGGAVCDARGFLRNDRPIMQLLTGIIGYAIAWALFLGQPEGGHWFIHLILVVTVSQLVHYPLRNYLIQRG